MGERVAKIAFVAPLTGDEAVVDSVCGATDG
jgi:hypothetical protein